VIAGLAKFDEVANGPSITIDSRRVGHERDGVSAASRMITKTLPREVSATIITIAESEVVIR
jgi:hypothetical protein